jgi:redox-sensitive bicupin YhaK (pirin superfamily)
MSAGTGVQHSEFNPSPTEEVRFLQIWIEPEQPGLEPSYEQRAFPPEDHRNGWTLIASRDGREGSLTVHQDVALFRSLLDADARIEHRVDSRRHAWLQVISGEIEVNGQRLQAGDGGASDGPGEISITGIADESDVLLFDLS